jgi:hypothetical protein
MTPRIEGTIALKYAVIIRQFDSYKDFLAYMNILAKEGRDIVSYSCKVLD